MSMYSKIFELNFNHLSSKIKVVLQSGGIAVLETMGVYFSIIFSQYFGIEQIKTQTPQTTYVYTTFFFPKQYWMLSFQFFSNSI